MQTIRICRILESITPHLPELTPFVGKTVEIIVREESAEEVATAGNAMPWLNPLRGSVLRDDDPLGHAVPAEDSGCFHDLAPARPLDASTKDALRALLTQEQYEALVEVVDQGGPDVDAIRRLRAASMT